MTRAGAIIAVVGGWLFLGATAGTTLAEQPFAAPQPSASTETGAEAGTSASAQESPAQGNSFIDTLSRAIENALEGKGSGGATDGARDAAQNPAGGATSGAMALAARGGAPARGPVVVEMFTAQGCSSCPPADEMFARLAARPDVIALALHVDYWDYLGWQDPFAQPAFTSRQKGYARAARARSIYTPQLIVEGAGSVIGADEAALERMIAQEKARPARIALTSSGTDGKYVVEISAPQPLDQPAVVQIVRYAPLARVEILRGENAGMSVDYANVVTAWHAVADWDGQSPTRLNVRIEGDQPAVLLVQGLLQGRSGPLPGPVLAAARLN